jgi:acyl-CoA thioester hydrolase
MPMSSEADSASIEFRVRYAETDQMGVVYHANYLVWCELGRTELIRQRGAPYSELERQGVILAVADASVRYQAPARYDDLIRVEARVEALRSRTVTFAYTVLRVDPDGSTERLATASTTLICLDPEKRPRKLPADLIRSLADER